MGNKDMILLQLLVRAIIHLLSDKDTYTFLIFCEHGYKPAHILDGKFFEKVFLFESTSVVPFNLYHSEETKAFRYDSGSADKL